MKSGTGSICPPEQTAGYGQSETGFSDCGRRGSSPEYISIERGSSLVGNGEVSGFAVVAPEAFSLDVYTEICLLVDGAKAKTCYTDGYDDLIAKVKNRRRHRGRSVCKKNE